MDEPAMPDPASDANNLFEIIRTTSVDAGLGRSAVSLSPMSSFRTDGVRLTGPDRSRGGDYAGSGGQMALALTGAERRRGTLGRNSARVVDRP